MNKRHANPRYVYNDQIRAILRSSRSGPFTPVCPPGTEVCGTPTTPGGPPVCCEIEIKGPTPAGNRRRRSLAGG
jgi:hypothetical protein